MEIVVGVTIFLLVGLLVVGGALLVKVIVGQANRSQEQSAALYSMIVEQQPKQADAQAKATERTLKMLGEGIDKATSSIAGAISTALGTNTPGTGIIEQPTQDTEQGDEAEMIFPPGFLEDDPTGWVGQPVGDTDGWLRGPIPEPPLPPGVVRDDA